MPIPYPPCRKGAFAYNRAEYSIIYIYILQIYWDWIGNGVLITEGAMIISNSHG